MPTAVASFDDSFDFDEPARRKAQRKPRPAAAKGKGPSRKKGGKKRRFPTIDMQKATRWGAVGMSGALAVAIMVNALILQKGHHPAPLFGKAIALGPSPTATRVAAAVPATPAPDPEAAQPAAPQPAPAPMPRHVAEAETGGDDLIGALIAGKAPPPATPKVESRTVLGAQRALAKLGFTLKPSGTVGPQTRKAIEAFERDRHLPVNGELTPRLVKVLAAESGVKIQ